MNKLNPFKRSGLGLAVLIPVAVLILAGCSKKEEAAAPDIVQPVKMIPLNKGGLTREISLPGQIFPLRQANMAFEVPGLMTDIYVGEGQEVKEGELLARLDARDYQSALDAASAQLDNARIEMDRARSLFANQATSKQRVDAAESNLKVAQATFDKAQKAFDDTSMIAPISGVVARILVDDIVTVGAKQDILILQDNSSLKVTVDIPETLRILGDRNMTNEEKNAHANVRVSMTARPDYSYPAWISEVTETADPVTRTYKGTVIMERPDGVNILPGMTAKITATIPTDPDANPDAYHIPAQAVTSDEDGNACVWVVSPEDMTVQRRTVTQGTIVGENIEIFSDELSEGELVVTSGISNLKPGKKVRKFEL